MFSEKYFRRGRREIFTQRRILPRERPESCIQGGMISQSFLMLALGAFLGGGSLHGVVVNKIFKPLPLSHSLGMEGIYRLELRDQANKVHRQMVSREIFALYEVGDEFDESVPPSEVRARQAARRAKEAAAAAIAAAETERARVARTASDGRFAQVFLRRDMLPETEGF